MTNAKILSLRLYIAARQLLIPAWRENRKGQCSVFLDACGEEVKIYR